LSFEFGDFDILTALRGWVPERPLLSPKAMSSMVLNLFRNRVHDIQEARSTNQNNSGFPIGRLRSNSTTSKPKEALPASSKFQETLVAPGGSGTLSKIFLYRDFHDVKV
jgi:hypothetical protein